jgi:hypothetical protein
VAELFGVSATHVAKVVNFTEKGQLMFSLPRSSTRIVWGLLTATVCTWLAVGRMTGAEPADDPAVARARKTVMMLDDVYKTAVVLITDKYVNDEDDFPAGSAAIAWFDAINQKGWHEVRLLDATGMPHDAKNTARDEFDRQAIQQLKAGKTFYEQVEEKDGKRTLRAATPVPVVMKKCVMCHEHYADAKAGEPIGLLSYRVPIE